VHSVDVYLSEERGGSGDNWGNENLAQLSNLAKVTPLHKPGDVEEHVRLPETFHDERSCRIKTFVSKIVMGCLHYQNSLVLRDYELVQAL